jgi:hypothetical protein
VGLEWHWSCAQVANGTPEKLSTVSKLRQDLHIWNTMNLHKDIYLYMVNFSGQKVPALSTIEMSKLKFELSWPWKIA